MSSGLPTPWGQSSLKDPNMQQKIYHYVRQYLAIKIVANLSSDLSVSLSMSLREL
jgi:hypothetical protein